MTKNNDAQTKNFYNSNNLPPKVRFCSKKPSMVQESPLDAKSPQEVLQQHGMYKDESIYSKEPQKIYADLSEFGDFESNLNANRRMQEKFNALDVDVRARFNHNVKEFTKYVTSPDFDINNVLTKEEQMKLKEYNDNKAFEERQKNEHLAYINSEEYKRTVEESAMRAEYEKSRYEEWKANYIAHKQK